MPSPIAILVLDYPRLSETFVAQEIVALEARGLEARIVALRQRREPVVSELSRRIRAEVCYLPRLVHREPLRVLRAWWRARRLPGYLAAWQAFKRDFARDARPDRLLRFIQALVLAAELPARFIHLHAQFLYYPASVARYTALLRGLPWSCSAHAIDIWTLPDWEKREKLAHCRWAVTCTAYNAAHLRELTAADKVQLIYHGLDGRCFAPPPVHSAGPDGSRAEEAVVILSVGRVVEKKGYPDLLDALSLLPAHLHWRLVHIGGGKQFKRIRRRAWRLGLKERVLWLGAQAEDVVLQHYRQSDLFALCCRVAANGNRDGLPNVLLEAQSQYIPVVSTTVSAIPELIQHDYNGLLAPPGDVPAIARSLERLIVNPELRARMGRRGAARVREKFSPQPGIASLARRFGLETSGAEKGP